MSTPRRAGHTSHRTDPVRAARLQRDAGMERSRTITKGLAFGSVAAVAVAGVYLSQALPGHSASTSTTPSGAATPAAPTANSGTAPTSNSGTDPTANSGASYSPPSAPAYTPAPAYRQAPVVSSGSS